MLCCRVHRTCDVHGGREGGAAVVSKVLRVEEDGCGGRIVGSMVHGRGSDQWALLEESKITRGWKWSYRARYGCLQKWVLQELVGVCMGVREGETKASSCSFGLCFSETLLFRPSVLEPDLDLCLCQFQVLGKLCSFCHREVLLLAKLSLQRNQLCACKRSSGLPIFLLFFETCRAGAGDVSVCSGA